MSKRLIAKIRDTIRNNNYDITFHAIEEMAEDNLSIFDIENAILQGKIKSIEKDDPLGNKYIIEGFSVYQSIPIGIVGRFKETGIFLIITVYEIS